MKKYRPLKPPKAHAYNSAIRHGTSKEELELYNTIRLLIPKIPVYRSDRAVLHGREIDIWIPSLKIGFEYNGLFYHTDKKPDYHLYKTITAEQQGIRLVHIWSSEWEFKKVIVIDFVKKVLDACPQLDPKFCTFVFLSKKEGQKFLDRCHLLGDDPKADTYVGYLYNGDIVAVASLIRNEDSWDLLRYTTRLGIKIPAGLNYIVSEVLKIDSLPIYVDLDRRLDDGTDYKLAGFTERGCTGPDMWFTTDYKHIYPNKDFQRYKEANSEDGKLGILYDCGKKQLVLEAD